MNVALGVAFPWASVAVQPGVPTCPTMPAPQLPALTAPSFTACPLVRQPTTLQVVATINRGRHRGVSPNVAVTWAGRLVGSNTLLSPREQRALLALLAEMHTGDRWVPWGGGGGGGWGCWWCCFKCCLYCPPGCTAAFYQQRLCAFTAPAAFTAATCDPPCCSLLGVLDELGGIPRIVLRFFQHYEATTPVSS